MREVPAGQLTKGFVGGFTIVASISLALHWSRTTRDETATRRHIPAALDAGATRDEVLLVLKCGVGVAVHSCSLDAPILLEEMKAADAKRAGGTKPKTPACDAMRAIGQWNTEWDPFYELSPGWTDQFFAFATSIYKSGFFTPRFMELMSIAVDASVTHMYAPGTRPHIQGALEAEATPEKIMTVLQICVSMGIQAASYEIRLDK
jgi:alkylhydroperoxidase/carboxymuconolactone decarboxylase family protein YurZ